MSEFGVTYIYTFVKLDGNESMHCFRYPPSVGQLEKYLKDRDFKLGVDTATEVAEAHERFLKEVTNKYGTEEAAKYGKVA
jgi:hypothetical protein